MYISSITAEKISASAIERATKIGVAACVAVLDSGGHLKTFRRMDGAWLGSVDIAIQKAKTSILFNIQTQELGPLTRDSGPLHGAELTNSVLIAFAGGVPLRDEAGAVIGAVGVSGGTVEQDYEIAKAGAARFG